VNAGRVVASPGHLRSHGGSGRVLLAPSTAAPVQRLRVVDGGGLRRGAWAILRSMPIAALVGILMGGVHRPRGLLPASSVWSRPPDSLPFIVLIAPSSCCRGSGRSTAPRTRCHRWTATPRASGSCGPQIDRIVRWVVHPAGRLRRVMLTWLLHLGERVQRGLVYSIVSSPSPSSPGWRSAVTGPATLAGVGPTRRQLAPTSGSACCSGPGRRRGGRGGGHRARLRLGPAPRPRLALLTIAAALFFDNTSSPS